MSKLPSIEQWNIAQEKEKILNYPESYEIGRNHFKKTYAFYFAFLDISQNLKDRSIIEIGCANYPALTYCKNIDFGWVIEPTESDHLDRAISESKQRIWHIKGPCENVDFPSAEEVWLFNVLQHVMHPDLIIQKAKEVAQVIRFFEPINTPTDECHLHGFDLEYFRGHFGDCVTHYPSNKAIPGFHQHECAYGVYNVK